ncbi:MAG: Ig domain-containing protein [Methanocorpusculum sp.]|nr:Ig domain-containing protein [Methanocorpusculum sp.]
MSYIIRDRVWEGYTIVDGNNPPRVAGFAVAHSIQGANTLIKDYQNLTEYLGEVPHAIDRMRESCKLLGGHETRLSNCMPISDFLQFRPDFTPSNRPSLTPDSTIGRGGTFDIRYPNGSVFVKKNNETTEELADRIKKNIEIIYNYGDYDDAYAPAAESVGPGTDYCTVYVLAKDMPTAGYGRCVAIVALTQKGIDRINAMIQEKREINRDTYGGALHILPLEQQISQIMEGKTAVTPTHCFTWTEIMLVETAPTADKMLVSGAAYDSGTAVKAHVINNSCNVHQEMDFPAYRAFLSVPMNETTAKSPIPKKYAFVPIWDYTKRAVKWDTDHLECTITFNYVDDNGNGKEVSVKIITDTTKTHRLTEPFDFLRVTPLIPVVLSYKPNSTGTKFGEWEIDATRHPMINYDILPPVKIEATLKGVGMHFILNQKKSAGGTTKLKFTSEWETTGNVTEKPYKGTWRPGAYAVCEVTTEDTAAKSSAPCMWQGIPATIGSDPVIGTVELPTAAQDDTYLAKLEVDAKTAAYMTGPLKWDDGKALPVGLILDPSSGRITGIATGNTASVPFTVTDRFGKSNSKSISLAVTSNAKKPDIDVSKGLPQGIVGKPYARQPIPLKDGTCATSWDAPALLPTGLSIDKFGVISGVPADVFTGTIDITAKNKMGGDPKTVSLTIISSLAPQITTAENLPSAQKGKSYNVQIAVTGDMNRLTYTMAGKPPEGITLSPKGVLTSNNVTDKTGIYSFGILVENSFGHELKTFSIEVTN